MPELPAARSTPLIAASLLALATPCAARPAFFWTTTEGTGLTFEHLEMRPSVLEGGQGSSAGKRVTTGVQYDFNHARGWVVGLGHEYSDLDLADAVASPQTNGHLHTLHLATQWTMPVAAGEFRIAAAPAVSVSSNALKNPGELGRDSLQGWGAAVYSLHRGDSTLVIGAARDYRFGEARVYPVAGFEWHRDALALRAVFPDFRLAWQLGSGWAVGLEVSPDGNEWQALNRELTEDSVFRREAWQGQLGLRYRFGNGVELGFVAGRHWQQRWRYRRQGGEIADVTGDDRGFLGLRLGWQP